MNRRVKYGLLICAALVSFQSFAQNATIAERPSISVGFELGVPTGSLNGTQKIGIGGSAKAAFPVITGGDVTLSAGYISFSGDQATTGNITTKLPALNFIPLKAGFRYRFVPSGFYLEPQFGYTVLSTESSTTSAKGGFTYAGNIGYVINNQFDISARYEGISKKTAGNPPSGGNLAHVGFRLAYNFGL